MGGNGSYSKTWGGVPKEKRSHVALHNRIDGHKILLQEKNVLQKKIPMNSNSESPIYLCASIDKQTRRISISTIAIYKEHKLEKVIDLVFDKKNNFIPFSIGNGSHMHHLKLNTNGEVGRKKHDKGNTFPIPDEYNTLIEKIVLFNKKQSAL